MVPSSEMGMINVSVALTICITLPCGFYASRIGEAKHSLSSQHSGFPGSHAFYLKRVQKARLIRDALNFD
ncbi:hypothetical protein P170DRAFT_435009 [Aspergillus steynii IBT 23096]|uniref:Uncharacterized protein n=1 Tax=Aspergillus steynii IBT 23096 TaxID=1392250 RepID=A0A2I2GKG0_9EURO|nr:uncharacterized protein P170DRAFT_435009 [Aspergillus steynii IBT 23096]PLB53366.1 hypothetical protein P170DRAFT_435009 [Aspergillus steynii IBT 23096]